MEKKHLLVVRELDRKYITSLCGKYNRGMTNLVIQVRKVTCEWCRRKIQMGADLGSTR